MSCPACFSGGVTTSHPTGTETVIHGLPTYVATPEDGVTPKGLVVFLPDAFGWDFANNRVLADHYAKRGGFLVYCPDFMNGNSLHPNVLSLLDKIMTPASWLTTIVWKPFYILQAMFIGIPWRMKNSIPKTYPRVLSFVQALRSSPPPFATSSLKIGAAGFCWGGKHAFILAQDAENSRVVRDGSLTGIPERLIDAAFAAHPSYIVLPDDTNGITIPMSVAVGDKDMAMKEPAVLQMKGLLEGKNSSDGAVEHEVVIIPGAKHGFAIRTHPDDKHEMECAEKAEVQAIDWFSRWFAL